MYLQKVKSLKTGDASLADKLEAEGYEWVNKTKSLIKFKLNIFLKNY